MAAFPLEREVEYPSSDGKPMAETDLHREEMMYVIGALGEHFRSEPDVYVSGNLLLYFVEGDPSRSVSPDALVTRGSLMPRSCGTSTRSGKRGGRPPGSSRSRRRPPGWKTSAGRRTCTSASGSRSTSCSTRGRSTSILPCKGSGWRPAATSRSPRKGTAPWSAGSSASSSAAKGSASA